MNASSDQGVLLTKRKRSLSSQTRQDYFFAKRMMVLSRTSCKNNKNVSSELSSFKAYGQMACQSPLCCNPKEEEVLPYGVRPDTTLLVAANGLVNGCQFSIIAKVEAFVNTS